MKTWIKGGLIGVLIYVIILIILMLILPTGQGLQDLGKIIVLIFPAGLFFSWLFNILNLADSIKYSGFRIIFIGLSVIINILIAFFIGAVIARIIKKRK